MANFNVSVWVKLPHGTEQFDHTSTVQPSFGLESRSVKVIEPDGTHVLYPIQTVLSVSFKELPQ